MNVEKLFEMEIENSENDWYKNSGMPPCHSLIFHGNTNEESL